MPGVAEMYLQPIPNLCSPHQRPSASSPVSQILHPYFSFGNAQNATLGERTISHSTHLKDAGVSNTVLDTPGWLSQGSFQEAILEAWIWNRSVPTNGDYTYALIFTNTCTRANMLGHHEVAAENC